MEGSSLGKRGEGEGQVPNKAQKALQKCLQDAQIILDENQLLLNEISRNRESAGHEALARNCSLIRELYSNLKRLTDMYAGLSTSILVGQRKATTRGGPTETRPGQ